MSAHAYLSSDAGIVAGAPVLAGQSGTFRQFEVVTADPRTSTGLAREIGSTAVQLSGGAVTAVYTKYGSNATDWLAVSGATDEDYHKARAAALLQGRVGWFWEDFDKDVGSPGWDRVLSTGAITQFTNRAGGVLDIQSGAGASGAPLLLAGNGAVAYPTAFPAGTNGVWYVAARMRLVNAPDANSTMIVGGRSAAGNLVLKLGACGGISAANWSVQGDANTGAGLDSGIPVETTSFHVVEAWRVGGVTRIAVDGVVGGSTSANVFPTVVSGYVLTSQNGATASQKETIYDWFAAAWSGRESS